VTCYRTSRGLGLPQFGIVCYGVTYELTDQAGSLV
jgi:hypothetical protein